MVLRQRGLDLRRTVRLGTTGHNTRSTQPRIRRQRLEQIDRPVEEVRHLFGRLVVRVAVWVERGNACPMLAPFVFPEALGGASV